MPQSSQFRTEMLMQAASLGHVDQLVPATNPEYRQVTLTGGCVKRQLEPVTIAVYLTEVPEGLLAEVARMQVHSTAEDDAVDAVQQHPAELGSQAGDHERQSTGGHERLGVVAAGKCVSTDEVSAPASRSGDENPGSCHAAL